MHITGQIRRIVEVAVAHTKINKQVHKQVVANACMHEKNTLQVTCSRRAAFVQGKHLYHIQRAHIHHFTLLPLYCLVVVALEQAHKARLSTTVVTSPFDRYHSFLEIILKELLLPQVEAH